MFKGLRFTKHILEGHRWDGNMVCTRCGVSVINLDVFKNRHQLKFLTCEVVQALQKRERIKASYK